MTIRVLLIIMFRARFNSGRTITRVVHNRSVKPYELGVSVGCDRLTARPPVRVWLQARCRAVAAGVQYIGRDTRTSLSTALGLIHAPGEKLRYDVEGLVLRLWTLP